MSAETANRDVETRRIMVREALNEAMREEMARDERVFIMGEGIAQRGGSYKVTVGLLDEFGPKRVIDTPISEASFAGMGVGAAITGMRPVVEILFIIDPISGLINWTDKYLRYYPCKSGPNPVKLIRGL